MGSGKKKEKRGLQTHQRVSRREEKGKSPNLRGEERHFSLGRKKRTMMGKGACRDWKSRAGREKFFVAGRGRQDGGKTRVIKRGPMWEKKNTVKVQRDGTYAARR